ncbi:MAG: hypothetical protein FWH20_07945, partial [Oscillospiraceae bacterium]|nr:hypothetical protein [Oscillospiraceae bacterium]
VKELEFELALVLEKLKPFATENGVIADFLTPQEATELLTKLRPLLDNSDPEALDYLPQIRRLHGGEQLAEEIDDFDFEAALKTMQKL